MQQLKRQRLQRNIEVHVFGRRVACAEKLPLQMARKGAPVTQPDNADLLIEQLGLKRHPEGGWYKETWRATAEDAATRAKGTAILFLIKADEVSHWHRVDADEMWLWQGGDPLELSISSSDAGPIERQILGTDFSRGQVAQGLVPTGAWQSARVSNSSTGKFGYTLVSCVVVPGFDFAGFELAPPGWAPGTEQAA